MHGAENLAPDTAYARAGELYRNQTPIGKRERLGDALRLTGRLGALALTLTVAHGVVSYKADVDEVKASLAHTRPYVTEYAPPPDPVATTPAIPHGLYETLDPAERSYADTIDEASHTVVINVSGLGLPETYEAPKVFKQFEKLGAGWTLHNDNKGIDPDVIARMIVDRVHDDSRGINRIAFIANSMGAITATAVAAKIAELDPNISFPFIVMDSPAIDLSVVRKQSVNDGYALLNGMHIPGAEYSRDLRMFAEMYLRRDLITDLDSFIEIYTEVHHEIFENHDLPSNLMLAKQFQLIINSKVKNNLKTLGALSEERQPVIVFVRAADPDSDDVVDTEKAFSLLQKWTDESGLQLVGPDKVRGKFYHGAQWRSLHAYRKLFGRVVIPQIEAVAASRNEPADTGILLAQK